MTAGDDPVVGIDRLKDHYKHCIRLSASNKINTKNAFDLQLIDYMQDLVKNTEDGQMNFKIASSALDVGAKIYSNRVDRIQTEAQKVASSILMALDGPGTGKHQSGDGGDDGDGANISGGSDRMNDTTEGEEGSGQNREKDKRKLSRKKNAKTVVEDVTSLDTKVERIVSGDTYLDGLSRDFDMTCPAALICYNALTQPIELLTVESNNLRKNYMEHEPKSSTTSQEPVIDLSMIVEETDNDGDVTMVAEEEIPATSDQDLNSEQQFDYVTLVARKFNCSQILRNHRNAKTCPRLETFLFNDRSTRLAGSDLNEDTTRPNSSQGRVYVNKTEGGTQAFNPEHYGANLDDDYVDDHYVGEADSVMGDNDGDDDGNPIPDLDKIAASKPTEYGYNEHHRLMNTWAGPHAWKVLKGPQNGKTDVPKSTRKRTKIESTPIDFNETYDPEEEKQVDKDIRIKADVLKKWKRTLLPQDHNLNDEKIRRALVKAFLRPEDTYHCGKTPAEARLLVRNDHNYHRDKDEEDSDGGFHSPAMGGFDDVHDDSDLEFRADPVVDGQEVAIYGAPINNTLAEQADLEFAGENLIEQPFEVAQVNIPFAKTAKKMDVRRLKRVMWDLLLPPEKRDSLNATVAGNAAGSKEDEAAENGKSTENSGDETAFLDAGGDGNGAKIMNSTPLKKTPSPTPSESAVHLQFLKLYKELPVRVSDKMAKDLSPPIAFVTLLHLANEKNLKLIPNQDLKDFIIEQDETT